MSCIAIADHIQLLEKPRVRSSQASSAALGEALISLVVAKVSVISGSIGNPCLNRPPLVHGPAANAQRLSGAEPEWCLRPRMRIGRSCSANPPEPCIRPRGD